jgi:GTP-binding protein Era
MTKSAFVAIVGRPSVGKSTLLNLYCDAHVSITSPVPQTTRNTVRGIVTRDAGQLVFLDTPGIHISTKKMNLRLRETALASLGDADIILYMLDAGRKSGMEEEAIAEALCKVENYAQKLFVAVNKSDLVPKTRNVAADAAASVTAEAAPTDNAPSAVELPFAAFLKEKLPEAQDSRVHVISCLKKKGTEALLASLFGAAPEGEPWYSSDVYTDQDIHFRIAEIIRGEAMNRLREELPHAIFVEIEDLELKPASAATGEEETLWVRAVIHVEHESQKGMVVGKDGKMIRAIRIAATMQLIKIFDWHLELDLRVKTSKDWRKNDRLLKTILK